MRLNSNAFVAETRALRARKLPMLTSLTLNLTAPLILDWMRTPPDRPAPKPRKPGMQVKPAVKVAVPALPRKGSRMPPTSVHNPNTPAARKRNRGPPK
jgi:hypothetical protein